MPAVISRDLKAKIDDMIALANHTGNIFSITRAILKTLLEAGLVYKLRIAPRLLLVHRSNRDGYGVGCHDVHEVGDILVDIGWDEEACHPVCTEVTDEDVQFNYDLTSEANGMLGSSDFQYLATAKFVTLSCSHTNFFMRIVLDGVAHKGSQKICKGGHFDMNTAKDTQPALHVSCRTGLEWQVIRPEALAQWPTLADMVQQQGNTKADRGEHDLQIVRRVHGIVQAGTTNGLAPAYDEVKEKALKSKPKCAPSLQLAFDSWHL
jgi:hypothetical protein